VLRSSIYLFEVVCYCFLNKVTILNDLLLSFSAFYDLPDHRIIDPDHEDFIHDLVELFHIPFSDKVFE
jgi:hypothetical protein